MTKSEQRQFDAHVSAIADRLAACNGIERTPWEVFCFLHDISEAKNVHVLNAAKHVYELIAHGETLVPPKRDLDGNFIKEERNI